jgi:LCP family protein required for cell wall assembly
MASPTTPPVPETPARRGWLKRGVILFLVLANVAVFGTYFAIRYYTGEFLDSANTNQEVVGELSERVEGEPVNILVIGSDSRDALPEDFGDYGNFGGQRADVIMVIRLGDGDARILSLPRDLRVPIEGHGSDKINAAYAYGGAPLMVKTVTDFTGIPIHHYMEMDFFGFASIVDELGGVEINFPNPARDAKSQLSVEAGRQTLDGQMALAYARSRHYEELRNGSWVSVDGSDFGRIARQQSLIFAMLSAAKRPSIVFDAGAILNAVGDHVTIDAAIDQSTVISLALRARDLSPSQIQATTLPTSPTTEGGVYYLIADEPGSSEVISAFIGDGGLVASSEPTRTQVLNGNGGAGQAGEWATALENLGFQVDAVGDATAFDFQVTQIQARPADLARAQEIAEALGFGEVATGTMPADIDVVVILGLDALDQG